jgi:rhizosphere induced protein
MTADANVNATQYTLHVYNESTQKDFCLFQSPPDLGNLDPLALAWFVKSMHQNTFAAFRWTIDYSFVWGDTGQLKPGIQFDAGQVMAADPSDDGSGPGQNQAHFDLVNGAYLLTPGSVQGARAGSLYIQQGRNIAPGTVSVGIGMSGSGTCAVQAEKNIRLAFTPEPKYWIVAGSFTQGEVIDVSAITGSAEVAFGNGYSMTAILSKDNKWTVKATTEINFDGLRAAQERHRLSSPAAVGAGR